MLHDIVLDDFKSFAHAEAKLGAFTLLVGASDIGTSSWSRGHAEPAR